MGSYRLIFATWIFLLGLFNCHRVNADDYTSQYTFAPMKIGGGGWVVGMWAHPGQAGLIYARVDVTCAYRYLPATKSWKNIVTTTSMPPSALNSLYQGVDSIIGSLSDPRQVYMSYAGKIYHSENNGDTWIEASTGFAAAMNANGDGRTCGERLAIDPHNPKVVYYGSIKNGLWVTLNGGTSWNQVSSNNVPTGTSAKYGITTVEFDSSRGVTAEGRTKRIIATAAGCGVFATTDAGETWIKISGTNGVADDSVVYRAAFDKQGNYFLIDRHSGKFWRYSPSRSFTLVTTKPNCQTFAIDPFNPERIFLLTSGYQNNIWRTTNSGVTWNTLSPITTDEGDSPYLKSYDTPRVKWISAGTLLFDPFEKDRLWLSCGWGVMTATNLSAPNIIPWYYRNNGIESLVSEGIIHVPGHSPIGIGADLGGFRFADPTHNQRNQLFTNGFVACWSIDSMGTAPGNLAALIDTGYNRSSAQIPPGVARSFDGGISWQYATNHLPGMQYGNIAISATDPENLVWLPANKSGIYFSRDGGKNWQNGRLNDTQNIIPGMGWVSFWIHRKALVASRALPNTFWVMNEDLGKIYRSSDGGATWHDAGIRPCSYRYNSELRIAPGTAADLWYAEGKEQSKVGGLWRYSTAGNAWVSLTNSGLSQAYNVAFGKSKTANGFPTIFVNGVVNGSPGIYRSTNEGNTWDLITRYPLDTWSTVSGMDGDKDEFGKVYLAFDGMGFAVGSVASP